VILSPPLEVVPLFSFFVQGVSLAPSFSSDATAPPLFPSPTLRALFLRRSPGSPNSLRHVPLFPLL